MNKAIKKERKKIVYALLSFPEYHLLHVSSSKKDLKKAVDCWAGLYPERSMVYEGYDSADPAEALCIDLAYIAPNEKLETIKSKMSYIPLPKYYGINLLKINLEEDDFEIF